MDKARLYTGVGPRLGRVVVTTLTTRAGVVKANLNEIVCKRADTQKICTMALESTILSFYESLHLENSLSENIKLSLGAVGRQGILL